MTELVTDAEIRALRDRACTCDQMPLGKESHQKATCDDELYRLCWVALGRYPEDDARMEARRLARERVAETLRRNAGQSQP